MMMGTLVDFELDGDVPLPAVAEGEVEADGWFVIEAPEESGEEGKGVLAPSPTLLEFAVAVAVALFSAFPSLVCAGIFDKPVRALNHSVLDTRR